MSMSPLLFLRLLLLLAAASGAVSRDDKFNCRFIFDGALHNTACKVALFHSRSSFYFDSHRIYVAPEDYLCSLDAHLQSIPTAVRQAAARHVVAVRRGSCSFLTKSEVATSAGYAGLIIINTGGEEPFPFGEQEDLSSQLVPAVMVESGFEQAAMHWCAKSDSEACLVDRSILSYGMSICVIQARRLCYRYRCANPRLLCSELGRRPSCRQHARPPYDILHCHDAPNPSGSSASHWYNLRACAQGISRVTPFLSPYHGSVAADETGNISTIAQFGGRARNTACASRRVCHIL